MEKTFTVFLSRHLDMPPNFRVNVFSTFRKKKVLSLYIAGDPSSKDVKCGFGCGVNVMGEMEFVRGVMLIITCGGMGLGGRRLLFGDFFKTNFRELIYVSVEFGFPHEYLEESILLRQFCHKNYL